MTVVGHVISGTSLTTGFFMSLDLLRSQNICLFRGIKIGKVVIPQITAQDTLNPVFQFLFRPDNKFFILYFILCFLCFTVGNLIPDIDNTSFMSKNFIGLKHVEHRTITHTMWVVFFFAVIGIFIPFVMWFAIGIFMHIFIDNFSRGGIAFFYPFTKYRYYGDKGAKVVKRKHPLKLYTTGKPSEGFVCTVFFMLCLPVVYLWIKARIM